MYTDQINTLRIILEQASQWQKGVYLTFGDFEKAFDTVRWASVWSLMGVPEMNITWALYKNYSCKVTHSGLVLGDITVHAGVRQGSLLVKLLFLVVLDGILHNTIDYNPRGIEWGLANVVEDVGAEYICFLSHTRAYMQAK